MDSLDSPFTIEFGGKSIVKVAGDFEGYVQAETGSEPAVFTLNNGRLSSGDYVLGRSASEDRSFLPKPIFWFKKNDGSGLKVQTVTAQERGESYQLIFTGAGLIVEEGKVFGDLSGNDESKVILKLE
ncbi:hypothetical protein ACHAQA_003576 [Verticillium albo-atrum]